MSKPKLRKKKERMFVVTGDFLEHHERIADSFTEAKAIIDKYAKQMYFRYYAVARRAFYWDIDKEKALEKYNYEYVFGSGHYENLKYYDSDNYKKQCFIIPFKVIANVTALKWIPDKGRNAFVDYKDVYGEGCIYIYEKKALQEYTCLEAPFDFFSDTEKQEINKLCISNDMKFEIWRRPWGSWFEYDKYFVPWRKEDDPTPNKNPWFYDGFEEPTIYLYPVSHRAKMFIDKKYFNASKEEKKEYFWTTRGSVISHHYDGGLLIKCNNDNSLGCYN